MSEFWQLNGPAIVAYALLLWLAIGVAAVLGFLWGLIRRK